MYLYHDLLFYIVWIHSVVLYFFNRILSLWCMSALAFAPSSISTTSHMGHGRIWGEGWLLTKRKQGFVKVVLLQHSMNPVEKRANYLNLPFIHDLRFPTCFYWNFLGGVICTAPNLQMEKLRFRRLKS